MRRVWLLMLAPVWAWAQSVTVAEFESVAVFTQERVPARAEAVQTPVVASEVSGKIVDLPVKVGQVVVQGQPLARLDCRIYEAQQAQTQAERSGLASRLSFAQRQLQRAENAPGAVTSEALDGRRVEVQTLQSQLSAVTAALTLAQIQVDNCSVESPVSGSVTHKHVSLGDYATPGGPLVTLQGEEIEGVAEVKPSQLAVLQAGQALRFQTGDAEYPVEVARVVPLIARQTNTQQVRLRFSEASALPGASGDLVWLDPQPKVPSELLIRRGGQLGVFVAVEGKAAFVPLEDALEGRDLPLEARLLGPLIVEGRQRLNHGDSLQIQ